MAVTGTIADASIGVNLRGDLSVFGVVVEEFLGFIIDCTDKSNVTFSSTVSLGNTRIVNLSFTEELAVEDASPSIGVLNVHVCVCVFWYEKTIKRKSCVLQYKE